jgi:hypothetical protein
MNRQRRCIFSRSSRSRSSATINIAWNSSALISFREILTPSFRAALKMTRAFVLNCKAKARKAVGFDSGAPLGPLRSLGKATKLALAPWRSSLKC